MYEHILTGRRNVLLISNFCCVLNVVCFLLGNSPASEFYMEMERTECSETLAYKIQTLENYPEESIQQKKCSLTKK